MGKLKSIGMVKPLKHRFPTCLLISGWSQGMAIESSQDSPCSVPPTDLSPKLSHGVYNLPLVAPTMNNEQM